MRKLLLVAVPVLLTGMVWAADKGKVTLDLKGAV